MKSVLLRFFTGALLACLGAAVVRLAAEDGIKPADPAPPFVEKFGKLTSGLPVPDLTLQAADGSPVKLSTLIRGKTAVLTVWRAGNGLSFVDSLETSARQYAGQGVQFIALVAYSSQEEYTAFLEKNKGRFSYPVVFDPVGKGPMPAKDYKTMSPEEQQTFMVASGAHMRKQATFLFTGRQLTRIPSTTVIDAQGRMIGFYTGDAGDGGPAADALSTLLLRAGVNAAAKGAPGKVVASPEAKRTAPPQRGRPVAMLTIGEVAPDFPATDVEGHAVKPSDFRGKIIILDFWATWCGPCINSMPHTQEVAEHYKDQGVVVLANCTMDERAKFDTWVRRNQSRFPDMNFSHDPQERGPERASFRLYGVNGIPQQFIIGRDGRIAARCTGYLKGEVLLEAALAQAGVTVAPEILAKAVQDAANRSARH